RGRRRRDPRSRRDGAPPRAARDRERGRLARDRALRPADDAGTGFGGDRASHRGEGVNLRFTLNGEMVAVEARTDEMLRDVLNRLGLVSVRETCGIGVCGVCSVLFGGETVSACLLLAPLADGREVTTVEGLGGDHPVQAAFAEAHAFQCGYCTPAMGLAASG